MPARIACGASDGLDERGIRAQEALFVRVEDGDERNLGHVQSLAQEVDADEYIERTRAQVVDDLRTLDGRNVRVEVAHLDPRLTQILGEVLRHALREGRNENAFIAFNTQTDL